MINNRPAQCDKRHYIYAVHKENTDSTARICIACCLNLAFAITHKHCFYPAVVVCATHFPGLLNITQQKNQQEIPWSVHSAFLLAPHL